MPRSQTVKSRRRSHGDATFDPHGHASPTTVATRYARVSAGVQIATPPPRKAACVARQRAQMASKMIADDEEGQAHGEGGEGEGLSEPKTKVVSVGTDVHDEGSEDSLWRAPDTSAEASTTTDSTSASIGKVLRGCTSKRARSQASSTSSLSSAPSTAGSASSSAGQRAWSKYPPWLVAGCRLLHDSKDEAIEAGRRLCEWADGQPALAVQPDECPNDDEHVR